DAIRLKRETSRGLDLIPVRRPLEDNRRSPCGRRSSPSRAAYLDKPCRGYLTARRARLTIAPLPYGPTTRPGGAVWNENGNRRGCNGSDLRRHRAVIAQCPRGRVARRARKRCAWRGCRPPEEA